ncbi:hypothetical protein COU37_02850 [Candidatus Micrarchaeota archaeon CG10_big_fil_rev_8_21_14_0_10_45_29]|nr:MAG: hypothetical protein COU37_02850 [Candidatus Micrarchaeota archaeon CG10_big_fil_rev_8_21_14_0_10_45_29]
MKNIVPIAKSGEGKSPSQIVKTANSLKARILSNKEFDKRLVLTDTWKNEMDVYPALNTFLAYEKTGKKLGSCIEYTEPISGTRYVFDVPENAKGEKNIALAINHGFDNGTPIFSLEEEGKNTVYVDVKDMSKIKILENFPSEKDAEFALFVPDDEFGIPLGNAIHGFSNSEYKNLRALARTDVYANFVIREYGDPTDFDGYLNMRIIIEATPSVLEKGLTAGALAETA